MHGKEWARIASRQSTGPGLTLESYGLKFPRKKYRANPAPLKTLFNTCDFNHIDL